MSKSNYQIVGGICIYPIDYLMNEELTEFDLVNLFETPSLLYSYIVGMYKYIGNNKSILNIINEVRRDNKWTSRYKWTKKQQLNYEDIFSKVIKNIYCTSDKISKQKAEWYTICYGFDIA